MPKRRNQFSAAAEARRKREAARAYPTSKFGEIADRIKRTIGGRAKRTRHPGIDKEDLEDLD
jgi:hypothetical protein